MPFKLKLKKTRQYNVASKSLFVISVELLDGGVADCTLSVDSTGQECLDNVCQRQAINQPEFFGLRYVNRNQQPRWVQLDRPLKLQLDKYASSHQLYLRVMYYVISGTSLITDEVTRYHYFLQLKNDLVEGRIICDCEQAVVLASYSRQAEYGNHDRERHTVEYLKNLLTFPKQMLDGGQIIDSSSLAETGRLEWLTAAVIQHHMSLNNMSQAQAEEGFITTCQQLRGYGQEMFAAKDKRDQTEVTIAISLTGIRVLTDASDTPHFYRWMDITNVINHKRTFSVECQQRESASFSLPSPDDGKYVWRMCVLQHTFYMKHQTALNAAVDEPRPKFQEHCLSESREELSPCGPSLEAGGRTRSASCLELADSQALGSRALLPVYRPAPDYETAVQQKYGGGGDGVGVGVGVSVGVGVGGGRVGCAGAGSQPDVRRAHFPDVTRHTAPADDYSYGLKYVGNYPVAADRALHYVNVYKPPPPYPSNGLASNSTPDLAVAGQALGYRGGYVDSHVSGSSPDLVSTRTALGRQYLGYVGPHGVVDYGRATRGTFDNLASVLEPNHIIIDPHLVSDDIQKVYDERGNVMYSMPVRRISYQRHVVVPPMQQGETQEPIYENVPLPWQAERRTVRERAQSLTTTDELARLNERNGIRPVINDYGNLKINVPFVPKLDNDSHYMNAQIIKGVRESSVPRESSDRSVHGSKENMALNLDRISLKNDEKDYDETPYTSLSTHRASHNNTISKSVDNVTSINISDVGDGNTSHGTDSALSSSVLNSTYSTSIELEGSKTSAKEKKRRRWGMFMGRSKNVEAKSATLGRDRAKAGQTANKHRWSTGLPKFQPLPPSITKETLCQLLERKMSDEQLSYSFSQIPKAREATGDHHTATTTTTATTAAYATSTLAADPTSVPAAALASALAGARGDAQHGLPYDDNRVRLHPTPGNPHGYINASHITMTVGSSQRFYVLIQATASEQAALLWECVWQVGARVLALVDGDPPRYLPDDRRPATYGQFQVSCGDWSVAPWGGSRRVSLRRAGGPGAAGASRALWHVRCAWPTEEPGFLDFMSEINGLSRACEAEAAAERSLARNAPLALCGRGAGVALAAHLLLHVLDANQVRPPAHLLLHVLDANQVRPPAHLLLHVLDANQVRPPAPALTPLPPQELDVPRTVSLLHQQRASLLRSVQQYRFLHLVLLHYLRRSRLI